MSCFFMILFSLCMSFAALSCEDRIWHCSHNPEMQCAECNVLSTQGSWVLMEALRYVSTLSDWFILDVNFLVLEGTTASCEPAGKLSSSFSPDVLAGPKLVIISGFMDGRAPDKKRHWHDICVFYSCTAAQLKIPVTHRTQEWCALQEAKLTGRLHHYASLSLELWNASRYGRSCCPLVSAARLCQGEYLQWWRVDVSLETTQTMLSYSRKWKVKHLTYWEGSWSWQWFGAWSYCLCHDTIAAGISPHKTTEHPFARQSNSVLSVNLNWQAKRISK